MRGRATCNSGGAWGESAASSKCEWMLHRGGHPPLPSHCISPLARLCRYVRRAAAAPGAPVGQGGEDILLDELDSQGLHCDPATQARRTGNVTRVGCVAHAQRECSRHAAAAERSLGVHSARLPPQLVVTCEVCRRPATKQCWTCSMAICEFCTLKRHWKASGRAWAARRAALAAARATRRAAAVEPPAQCHPM